MPSSIVRAVITPEEFRRLAEAAAGHPTYPAHVAPVISLKTRERVA